MKFETIIGLVAGVVITYITTTLIYDFLKENDKSEKYLNRKFEYTFLDLIGLGFYHALQLALGGFFAYLGFVLVPQTNFFSLLLCVLGCLITINFFLFFNHLFYELVQKITIDKNTMLISCKRFGQVTSFYLNDAATLLTIYEPPYQKRYGGRGIRCFGADFGICKISNGGTTLIITQLNRIKIKELTDYIAPDNTETVLKQVNFVL